MEKQQTINEYVAAEMGDKIVRKAKSPLLGLLLLGVGIGLVVLLSAVQMGDALQAACLTFSIIGSALGIILTAMCLTKTLWRYVYLPTRSKMRQCTCYLSNTDYQITLEAIRDKRLNLLASLPPVVSSNSALSILYSHDHAVALLQAGRYDSGHFEPETPVVCLTGTEVTHIQALCK